MSRLCHPHELWFRPPSQIWEACWEFLCAHSTTCDFSLRPRGSATQLFAKSTLMHFFVHKTSMDVHLAMPWGILPCRWLSPGWTSLEKLFVVKTVTRWHFGMCCECCLSLSLFVNSLRHAVLLILPTFQPFSNEANGPSFEGSISSRWLQFPGIRRGWIGWR